MTEQIVLEINANDALGLIGSLELTISTYGKIGEDYRGELICLKQKIYSQLEAQGIRDIEKLIERLG